MVVVSWPDANNAQDGELSRCEEANNSVRRKLPPVRVAVVNAGEVGRCV